MPTVIQVDPIQYVVVSDHTARTRMVQESETAWSNLGLTQHSKQLILISPEQGLDYLRVTMIHELLHCILQNGPLSEDLGDDEEERLVCGLDAGLLDLLRRNPALVDWLMSHGT